MDSEVESSGTNNFAADLKDWARGQPAWMQDALRRILSLGDLAREDVDQLTAICRAGGAGATPLNDADLQQIGKEGADVSLMKVASPKNINALAEDQGLDFGPQGLSIIYGDNGVGKSGYVRILKHACRARLPKPVIHPQVKDIGKQVEQSAMISYLIGGREETRLWTPGGETIGDLHNVSIFDSRSAATHVEIENEVAYTPYLMRVLSKLAVACDDVTSKLNLEVATLRGQTPAFIQAPTLNSKTAAGDYLTKLSAKSNLDTLDKLCTLNAEERAKFDALDQDLAQDPKVASARLVAQAERMREFQSALDAQIMLAGQAAQARCQQLSSDLRSKQEIAATASKALFSAAPLEGVGESVWQALWMASKSYARHISGEDKGFPRDYVAGDRCLLCQQELDSPSLERLQTFEDFVEGTARADEVEAQGAWDTYRAEVRAGVLSLSTIRDFVRFVGKELADEELAASIRSVALRTRRLALSYLRGSTVVVELTSPRDKLVSRAATMTERARALSSDSQSPAYLALKFEHASLKDRLDLALVKADVVLEIERRQTIAMLENRIKDARKRPVTDKNKELSEVLITDALRGRFAREISGFRVGKMPIELIKTKDSNATSYFKVVLVEHPKAKLGDILSEGEHRCVALAAFLAELATANNVSAIVFDDPMSSLDHLHREKVAARLVEEAKVRQVIVFTHDLTFLGVLRRMAEEEAVASHFRSVIQRAELSGIVEGDLPLKGKSALAAASALKAYLKQNKGRFLQMADLERKIFAAGFIEQLRETWDQGIADFISPVLGRFDNKIKGNSLPKLAVLNAQDIATIDAARGRLSEDLHNRSEALNPAEVTPDQLLDEIKLLEDWLTTIHERQKAVSTRGDR